MGISAKYVSRQLILYHHRTYADTLQRRISGPSSSSTCSESQTSRLFVNSLVALTRRRARFHYNANTPDTPWHITVDIGNRNIWDNGKGFFRRDYHIYAKNGDLSQGYAGYSSSALNTSQNRNIDPSEWSRNTSPGIFVPWGAREWFRSPRIRKVLFEATQQGLEPPASSQLRETKSWTWRPNPITGVLEEVEFTSISDLLDDLLNSIQEGASKPARPTKGNAHHVIDYSGNWVHINEAIKDAIKQGKEVLSAWKIILQNLHASLTKELKATSRLPVTVGATRSARSKTARLPRTIRPPSRLQKWSLKPNDSVGPDKSSAQQLEPPSRSDEWLSIREAHTGASEPGSGGDTDNQPQESMVPQSPDESKATTRTSRTKPTIRGVFDRDAGVGFGGSASKELASKVSHGRKPVATPDASQPQARVRPRTRGSDVRKPGKKMSSPLPSAAADLSS